MRHSTEHVVEMARQAAAEGLPAKTLGINLRHHLKKAGIRYLDMRKRGSMFERIMLREGPDRWWRAAEFCSVTGIDTRYVNSRLGYLIKLGRVEKRFIKTNVCQYRLLVAALLMLAAGPAEAHDFYSGLRSPDTGRLCCNERDCQPVDWRPDGGPLGSILADGHWLPVPEEKLLAESAPDLGAHACWRPGDYSEEAPKLLCVILGLGT